MIELDHVTFNYSAQGEQEVPPALRDVSLRIGEGETIAVIGQNGSGKSTLMKLMAAILQPQEGSILVNGLPTSASGQDIWTIRQLVGIVFQNPDDQLIAGTVIDDIAFGPENLGLPLLEIEQRVQEALTLLDLEAYAQMAVSELSLSLKQRVAIAGVLAMRPRYLLLDEPTTMISGQMARHLIETVQRLAREQGITVIHITHFMHEITSFGRVIVMDAGEVIMDGPPAAIFAQADRLQAVGLDVPLVTQLGRRLSAHGWTQVPSPLLSAAQFRTSIAAQASADGLRPALPTVAPTPEGGAQQVSSSRAELSNTSRQRPIFELKDVYYTHQLGTPFAVEALHGLSLAIPAGQITALIGPTGSGKSSIIDLLAALAKPEAGQVFFAGTDIHDPAFPTQRFRAQVGVVFQSPEAQIFEETVGKDIAFGPQQQRVSLAESRRRVQASLEAVGLPYEDFRSRYTYALSGGQRRRVAIAGVLALEPRVIIFDEPLAGLDPRGRDELLHFITRLKERDELTIVYASSSLRNIIELADLVHVLDAGRLVFTGTPREALDRAQHWDALDIGLPETTQIALALRDTFPALRSDILDLAELEQEIVAALDRHSERTEYQEREERSV